MNPYVRHKVSSTAVLAVVLVVALFGFDGAAPARAVPACPWPATVADEVSLNDAIGCFNAALTGGPFQITLTGDINLNASLTVINNTVGERLVIEGGGFTVDGQGIGGVRPFEIAQYTDVTMQNITISGGNAPGNGGAILNRGSLTIVDSTISANTAGFGGGIMNDYGVLDIYRSTITGNEGSNGGGGIYTLHGAVYLTNSTISGNSAPGDDGGGIFSALASLYVTNSTLSDNTAASGGGIYFSGGSISLQNSIIANSSGGDCVNDSVSFTFSASHNLLESSGAAACSISGSGNITGQDPALGALADNGGPTHTHALVSTSAAVDAGSNALAVDVSNSALPYDQRGVAFPRVLGTAVDMGAFEYHPPCAPFPRSVGPEADLNNAISCYNTITAAGTVVITLTGDIDLTASTTMIDNATPGVALQLDGAGFTVDGQNGAGVRPFAVAAGSVVTMQNITISGGNPSGDGGGILNNGTLAIRNSTVAENQAGGTGSGGGIYSSPGADKSLTVSGSTFAYNTAAGSGGGIYSAGSVVKISNSTFSFNVAALNGGALLHADGAATISSSTISSNRANSAAGGGIWSANGTLTINDSIIADSAGPSQGSECVRNVTFSAVAASHTLIEAAESGACGLALANPDANGNIIGEDPLLGSLANNGGPTQTRALLAGSPAIDTGLDSLAVDVDGSPLAFDQRGAGFARVLGTAVDMGAFEAAPAPVCAFPRSVATEAELNNAIGCYNALAAAGTYQITLAADIDLSASSTVISNATTNVALVIEGGGFAVDGQAISGVRPFAVAANTTVTMQNITITGGKPTGQGGGINSQGTLTLDNSTVSGNTTTGGNIGGGILNSGTLVVTNSTISGNSTGSYGGGIWNAGTVRVLNSTVSGNTATSGGGGGIYSSSGRQVTIINSTLSGNSSNSSGGGIYNDGGTLALTNSTLTFNGAPSGGGILTYGDVTINNSIIANSTSGVECTRASGTVNASHSLMEDSLVCVNGTSTNNLSGDPALGPLADNGGPTQTHALLAGSPAIDSGLDSLAVDASSNPLTTDQRGAGFARILGTAVDMGAFETVAIVPPTSTPTYTPTNTAVPPTSTPTYTPTNTAVPATSTPTYTPTNTAVPATSTPTYTPTNTAVPATSTPTYTPTNTAVPATSTPTYTPTNTAVPATSTPTYTPTNTAVPATSTPTYTPTNTAVPATSTATATPGGCAPLAGIVQNPGFEDGKASWSYYNNANGGSFTADSSDPYQCLKAARLDLGPLSSNMQLYQKNLVLEANTAYRLTFAARSANGGDLSVFLQKHGSPYGSYGLDNFAVDLTPSWQTFTTTFTTSGFSGTDSDGRLRFWFPGRVAAGETVWIDAVVLEEAAGGPPATATSTPMPTDTATPGPTPTATNTPNPGSCTAVTGLLSNPDFETGTSPWTFYTNASGSYSTGAPAANCDNAAQVTISTVGSNMQLNQTAVTLVAGRTYQLSFAAMSNNGRDLKVQVFRESKTGAKFLNQNVNLNTSFGTTTLTFTPSGFSGTATDIRVMFYFVNKASAGTVYSIDAVRLVALP